VGWGQAVPVETWSYESVEASEVTLKNYLIPAVKGLNPTDLAAVHQAMNTVIRPSFSTGMPMTKAGIDLALHDLAGRLANKSVPEMWGRKPQQMVPLSWTLNPRTLDEVPVLMEEGRKLGYKHFNIKVAPDPKFDIAMAKEVRRHAPNCFLWADANGGYDLETALAVAPRLKDAGVDVLEQPLPANRLTGFAAMKKQGALPIIMDEGLVSSVELEEFIKLKLLDGIAMKPARTAGLWDARKQVQMALDNGLMFLGSGLTDPDLALAATLQLYGAYNLKYPAALNGLQFLAGSFLKKPFELEDGALRVPTGVGLGVEVDEKKVIENETSA
ncbi:MAG TPA: enolase C-terminal domain-like protein, partial [Bryobacteraceae bacterium]|nr:enolase C-terminal domain-like protein [Bryobacteraceae bacterium]